VAAQGSPAIPATRLRGRTAALITSVSGLRCATVGNTGLMVGGVDKLSASTCLAANDARRSAVSPSACRSPSRTRYRLFGDTERRRSRRRSTASCIENVPGCSNSLIRARKNSRIGPCPSAVHWRKEDRVASSPRRRLRISLEKTLTCRRRTSSVVDAMIALLSTSYCRGAAAESVFSTSPSADWRFAGSSWIWNLRGSSCFVGSVLPYPQRLVPRVCYSSTSSAFAVSS